MNVRENQFVSPKMVKIAAAIVMGLGVGTLIPPDPVSIPTVGPVSGILVGVIGVTLGAVVYVKVPKLVGTSSCGCSGECSCSD